MILAAPNSMRKPITYWQRHKTERRGPADIREGCGFQEFGAYSWLGSVSTLYQPQASNPTSQYHLFVRILLWAALFLYMAGVWILSSLGPVVTDYINATGIPDFFWHLGLYAGLCVLAIAAIGSSWRSQAVWPRSLQGAMVAFSYGVVDEVHQHFVPGRGTDLQDIAGNLVGVALVVACAVIHTNRVRLAAAQRR